MSTIIFCADLHVAASARVCGRRLHGDSFFALEQLCELALEIKPQHIIYGGDIYDTNHPGGAELHAVQRMVRGIAAKGIEQWSIQGNHDRSIRPQNKPYYDREYRITALPPVRALPPVGANLSGLLACGLDYTSSKTELDSRLDELPECDILVMHQAFQHMLGFEGAYTTVATDPRFCKVKKAVLCGHVHQADKRQLEHGAWFISPGSTWATDATELDHMHTAVLLKDGAEPEMRHLGSRYWKDCTGVEPEQLEQAVRDVLRENTVPLKPLILARDTSGLPDELHEQAVIAEQSPAIGKERSRGIIKTAASLRDSLDQIVDQSEQADLHTLLAEMIGCPDKQCREDRLREWIEKRGAQLPLDW